MSNKKNNQSTSKFTPLSELCKLLKVKGIKTAQLWCEKNNVPIRVIGNKPCANTFFIELEFEREVIAHLKDKYPEQWEDLYRCYLDNDRYSFIALTTDDNTKQSISSRRFSRTRPQSELTKKFAAS